MTDDTEYGNGRGGGGLLGWTDDFRICLAFLSRLPVPAPEGHGATLGAAMRALPAAGLVIGAIGGLVCVAALFVSLPAPLVAMITVAALLFVTGALHEDGLADVADGFGGGVTADRKLDIMKDSRIGSYGVLALICMVMLKIFAIMEVLASGVGSFALLAMFAALGAWSRTFCVSLMASTANARAQGLAANAGRPGQMAHGTALLTGALAALILLWSTFGFLTTIAVFAASAAAFWLVRKLALRQIGGHTGDVAGTVQVVCETTMLIVLAAAL